MTRTCAVKWQLFLRIGAAIGHGHCVDHPSAAEPDRDGAEYRRSRVGAALDLVTVRRGDVKIGRHASIDADNAYFRSVSGGWSDALRHALVRLPERDWLDGRRLRAALAQSS